MKADRLDAAREREGLVGPLHGIPVIVKDQADVKEMPTTMGSVLFEGHMPGAIASSRPSCARRALFSLAR